MKIRASENQLVIETYDKTCYKMAFICELTNIYAPDPTRPTMRKRIVFCELTKPDDDIRNGQIVVGTEHNHNHTIEMQCFNKHTAKY